MTPIQRRAIDLIILNQGMKGRDVVSRLLPEYPDMVGDAIIKELIELVSVGELLEVEYVLPRNTFGETISRSFLMPKGTNINFKVRP